MNLNHPVLTTIGKLFFALSSSTNISELDICDFTLVLSEHVTDDQKAAYLSQHLTRYSSRLVDTQKMRTQIVETKTNTHGTDLM